MVPHKDALSRIAIRRDENHHNAAMFSRPLIVAVGLGLGLVTAALASIWFWGELVAYIDPKDATDRKDVVQVFALIVAGAVGIVGAMVGLANVYFSRKNLEHNQESLNQQRLLEAERLQDATQQAYYEQIGSLLTEHGLRKSKVNDDVRLLAEAQTATVLQALDVPRKSQIVLFLARAQLIDQDDNIIVLTWADLRHVNLSNRNISETDFEGADLSHADLKDADLIQANLWGTDLIGADMRNADLSYSRLDYADLTDAKLDGVNLKRANLSNAKGVTDAELRKCHSVEGATMPDGQRLQDDAVPDGPTFDDWLKDREGHGKDGENSSPS